MTIVFCFLTDFKKGGGSQLVCMFFWYVCYYISLFLKRNYITLTILFTCGQHFVERLLNRQTKVYARSVHLIVLYTHPFSTCLDATQYLLKSGYLLFIFRGMQISIDCISEFCFGLWADKLRQTNIWYSYFIFIYYAIM